MYYEANMNTIAFRCISFVVFFFVCFFFQPKSINTFQRFAQNHVGTHWKHFGEVLLKCIHIMCFGGIQVILVISNTDNSTDCQTNLKDKFGLVCKISTSFTSNNCCLKPKVLVPWG